ncbi:MAG: MFS transporter [candidate division NC10 bacterium]|nr:MFS transporter [candidate division NC10 bacterium]
MSPPCAGTADPGGAALTESAASRPAPGLLALLSTGHMVVDINQGALPAILPFLREAFALSYTGAAAIMLVASVTSSVIQPLFGYLADRMACRWLLPLAVFVSGLGVGLTGIAPSYAMVLGAVTLAGLGIAAYHPEGYRTASQVAGARKATGLSFFSVGGNAGLALGPVIVTLFITTFGLPGSLGLLVPSVLAAGVLAIALPRLAIPGSVQPAVTQGASARPMVNAMAVLILIVTLRSWTQLGLTTFVPFYYLDVLHGEPRMVGPLLFAFLGAGAVGTLVGGRLADRWGPRRVILYAFLCATPLIAGFLLTRGIVGLLFLAGSGFMLVSTFTVSVVLAQAYLPKHLGMASGLIVGFAIGTGGIGVAGLGLVADRWGLLTALGLIAVMPLAGFFAARLLPEPPRT